MRLRLALLVLLVPATLLAQTVRGVVRDSASGVPAAGVLVALVDASSGERRTILTDETGQFSVAAAGAGTFMLEAKRIGVRAVLTPRFSLAAGETREINVGVANVVPRLAVVRVTGKSYCADRLSEGGETATLWEEVRAALTATLITRERREFLVTISRFRRVFHPTRLQIQSEDRSEQRGLASNPFTSVPMSVLASKGYIVPDARGTLYYHAPDVDVLLSAMFVRDHCFSLVEGAGTNAGLVGLAFRPTRARRVPDIAGVLWLEGATRELRRLEFNYTNDPFEGLWQRFPSYMEYMRLPSGAWIIRRWSIRMPLVEIEGRDPTVPGGGLPAFRRLLGILEQGAEASIEDDRTRISRAIAGVVFDSSAGRPLSGARVSLRGTPFAGISDDGGRFRIQLPDTATYLLAFEHPRLDSLGYDVRAREVRVTDTLTMADLAVPPLATVRAELCLGPRAGAPTSIVVGTVRTAAGAPAAWTTLRYRWSHLELVQATDRTALPPEPGVPVAQSSPGATLVADSRGRFVICDVAVGRYQLTLESETGEVAETEVVVHAGQIGLREVTLRRRK